MKLADYTSPPVYQSRFAEDRMMAAYREAAEKGVLEREDKKHRAAVLKDRRRLAAAQKRKDSPAEPVRTSADVLPYPTFRHVPSWERKKERTKEDVAFFAEMHEYLQERIRRRLGSGYVQVGEIVLSGQTVTGVREEGLRSEGYKGVKYKTLERWPSLVPRQSKLRTSKGGEALEKSKSKLLSLDEPMVEGNREMLGFVRLDTDRVWDSVEQAVEAFRHVAREDRAACPPNLLVGLVDRQGRFWRPHAIWLLPFSNKENPDLPLGPVLNKPKADGFRPEPVMLFKSVYYGLVAAFAECGADPEAPAMTQQVKNPLSPLWETVVVNDDICPTLGVHAQYLDLKQNKAKLIRAQAQLQSGLPLQRSNGLWNVFQKAAMKALSDWHFSGDAAYHEAIASGRIGGLAYRIHQAIDSLDLGDLARNKRGRKIPAKQIARVAASVSNSVATWWDPEKLDGGWKRGLLMHEVEGLKSVSARQAVGAAHAAKAKKEAADVRLTEAVELMMVEGQEVTRKALARVSGMSINTVRSKWSMVELIVSGGSNRCIVKKHPASPAVSHQTPPQARPSRSGSLPEWLLEPSTATWARPEPEPSEGLHWDDDGFTFNPDDQTE
jgi:hypothetical protein